MHQNHQQFLCAIHIGGLKMVYKRPKHVKTNYINEITGPWLDNQFFTDSLQSQSSLSLNGDHNSILKNSLVTLWDSLNTQQVYNQPSAQQLVFVCSVEKGYSMPMIECIYYMFNDTTERNSCCLFTVLLYSESICYFLHKFRHNSIPQFEIVNKNDSFLHSDASQPLQRW